MEVIKTLGPLRQLEGVSTAGRQGPFVHRRGRHCSMYSSTDFQKEISLVVVVVAAAAAAAAAAVAVAVSAAAEQRRFY